MPQIKVYPPTPLPDRGVSETQFKIWIEELEVYLSQEDKFRVFLDGEAYSVWESQENNPNRLTTVKGEDEALPDRTVAKDAAKLKQRSRDLRTILSIVGKCVSQGHYDAVVRHSTSLESIFTMLRCDYDIQQKGIHFLNIIDLKYDPAKSTPIAFYNQYRTLISNNLAKADDVIKYKTTRMTSDEKMSPMIEDMILLNVISEFDVRLPHHVRMHYTHKMGKSDRLMDFKNDIMTNVDKFLQELDKEENLTSIQSVETPRLAWISQKGNNQQRRQSTWRGRGRGGSKSGRPEQKLYCRLCHRCDMPRDIYTSHNIGDNKCTQLSFEDRMKLNRTSKFGNMANIATVMESLEVDDDDVNLAKEFGYDDTEESADLASINQVNKDFYESKIHDTEVSRCQNKLGYIAPVPTQLLTVFKDRASK